MHRWYGHPQINTRLPPEQFQAIRAAARSRGIAASFIVKELVAEWYRRGSEPVPEPQENVARSGGYPRAFVEMLAGDAATASRRAFAPPHPLHDDVSPKAVPTRLPSRVSRRGHSTRG